MTQDIFGRLYFQAAIIASVNSYIQHRLEDMDLTFDGSDKIAIVGSAHTPEWRSENIRWINSMEPDVSVLNSLLQEHLSDANITGVDVTSYGPASLGHTVKVEITATGITSENFEQSKP